MRQPYDLAILPRWDAEFFLGRHLAAASTAHNIVGFDPTSRPHSRREGAERALLGTVVASGEPCAHYLRHLRRLTEQMGIGEHWHNPPGTGRALLIQRDDECARTNLAGDGTGRRTIALAPGAGALKRRWPPAKFAEAAIEINERDATRFVLLGGKEDRVLADAFFSAVNGHDLEVLDLTGGLTLSESLAHLGRVDAFVGADSGLMHMASSMGTPLVVVTCHWEGGSCMSANAPERFGPWHENAIVVRPLAALPGCEFECVAFTPHCIGEVEPSRVARAVRAVIDMPRERGIHQ